MSTTPRTSRRPRALIAFATSALIALAGLIAPAAANAAPAESTVSAATLDWGVKSSFRGYVTSPIAHGSIQTMGGVTGAYTWSGGTGTASADATTGTVSFAAGAGVRFQGHLMGDVHALDLTFTQPQLVLTSATTARLLLDVDGREFVSMAEMGEPYSLNDVDFASVALPTPSVSGSTYTWSGAAVTLTEAGAAAFGGFYTAGTVLDPLTLTATLTAPAQSTTTSLQAMPAVAQAGEEVALTATVAPAAAGTVTFLDGATALGTAPVTDGVAGLRTSALPAGTHQLTASFAPADPAAFAASASPAVTVTVNGDTTEPGVWNPTIRVFLGDGTTPLGDTPVYDGDTLIVKGSGFDPQANIGGRGVPIPNTLPQGDYVVFGSFGAHWRPSADAPSSERQVGAQLWALTADTLAAVPASFRETIRAQWTELHQDGTFEAQLTVAAPKAEVDGGSFGVYTYAAGGMKNAEQEQAVTVDYRGTRPVTEPTIEVRADGTSDPQPGDDVTFVVKGLEQGQKVRFEVHSDPVDAGTATADAQGVASRTWTIPADFSVGDHEVQAFRVDAGGVSEETPFLVAPLTVAAATEDDDNSTPPAPVTPEQPEQVCVARSVTGGTMSWGLKQSFRSYVEGPIAKGDFTGGSFSVRSGSVNADAGYRGQISFSGSITATGHGGLLDFRLSSPRIVLNGDGTGALYAHISSTDTTGKQTSNSTVRFATLSLGGMKGSGSTLSVSGARAQLTAAGAAAFAGFYDAGSALDSASFQVNLGGTTECDRYSDPSGSAALATTGGDTPLGGIAVSVVMLLIGSALVAIRRRRLA